MTRKKEKISIEELKKRIQNDPNFVNDPRFNNSLEQVLAKYPEGVSAFQKSKMLMLTKEEMEEIYQNIIEKLRQEVNPDIG